MKKMIGLSVLACFFTGSVMASQTEILTKKVTISIAASNKVIRANEKVAYSIGCGHGQYDMFSLVSKPTLYIDQYDSLDLSNSDDLIINGNATKAASMKKVADEKECKKIVSQFEDKNNQVELTIHDESHFEINFR